MVFVEIGQSNYTGIKSCSGYGDVFVFHNSKHSLPFECTKEAVVTTKHWHRTYTHVACLDTYKHAHVLADLFAHVESLAINFDHIENYAHCGCDDVSSDNICKFRVLGQVAAAMMHSTHLRTIDVRMEHVQMRCEDFLQHTRLDIDRLQKHLATQPIEHFSFTIASSIDTHTLLGYRAALARFPVTHFHLFGIQTSPAGGLCCEDNRGWLQRVCQNLSTITINADFQDANVDSLEGLRRTLACCQNVFALTLHMCCDPALFDELDLFLGQLRVLRICVDLACAAQTAWYTRFMQHLQEIEIPALTSIIVHFDGVPDSMDVELWAVLLQAWCVQPGLRSVVVQGTTTPDHADFDVFWEPCDAVRRLTVHDRATLFRLARNNPYFCVDCISEEVFQDVFDPEQFDVLEEVSAVNNQTRENMGFRRDMAALFDAPSPFPPPSPPPFL